MKPELFAGDLLRALGARFEFKGGQGTCVWRVAAMTKTREGGAGQNC